MARLPRLSIPECLHHVLQRGNNRQTIFAGPSDQTLFLTLLAEHAVQHKVAVHAYVLMDNHFHLLATPVDGDGLPKMMQAVGRRYVRAFNQIHGRSGTLWEGRFRSTVLEAGRHLLPAMVYLDLNPVRAGKVAEACDYGGSSYGHYAGLRQDRWITPHPLFWGLGNTPFSREAAYVERVAAGLPDPVVAELSTSVLGGWALGSPAFVSELQNRTDRRLRPAKPGRPTRRPPTPSIFN
jgi:putative transposase